MEAVSSERPQDVGRKHRAIRKATPRVDPRLSVVAAYQRLMREELWGLLGQLRRDTGLSLQERERRWKLAIILAKELGADIEPPRKMDAPRVVDNAPAAADFG